MPAQHAVIVMREFKLPVGVQWGCGFSGDEKIAGTFTSLKTPEPIAFRRRWHRDGLRALSLDPKVFRLTALGAATTPPDGVETLVCVALAEGKVIVGFGLQPATQFLLGALPFRVLTRSEVEQEPRATTISEVWSTRDALTDPADRVRLLRATNGAGNDGVPMDELLGLVRWHDSEAIHTILRLVCDGELEIDLGRRISPETRVWRAGLRPDGKVPEVPSHPVETDAPDGVIRFRGVPECRTVGTPKKRPKSNGIRRRDLRQGELLLPISTTPERDSVNESRMLSDDQSEMTRRVKQGR